MRYLLALIGYPVAHSLSPAMHNAALGHLNLEGEYVLVAVEPERLAESVAELSRQGFAGFNVTIPHKEAVYRLSSQRTEAASQVGVANTIKFVEGGQMLAHNTDVEGFARAVRLLQEDGVPLSKACVLGNGGAARAAVQALFGMGVMQIVVVGRNRERLEHFLSELAEGTGGSSPDLSLEKSGRLLVAMPETIASVTEASDFDLIVNSTPVGQGANQEIPGWMVDALGAIADRRAVPAATIAGAEQGGNLSPAPVLFYDMVYARSGQPTLLVARARELGFRASDGLEMLVQQAALSFEFWTGLAVPPQVMREAALDAIRGAV